MKKKVCVMIIIACIFAISSSIIATASTNGTCGDNVTWSFDNGTLTISGKGNMTDYAIADSADGFDIPWFSLIDSIDSVVIENGVTRLGNCAFYSCYNLKNVTIPNSVTTIGQNAFTQCENLTNIIIPNNVTVIEKHAFSCTGLETMTWPNNVKSIEGYTFYLCPNLTNVIIPSSVTSIGDSAFRYCSQLTSINVNDNNPVYCSIDGSLFSKDKTNLIQYPIRKRETTYRIPNGVTSVNEHAFSNCKNLTDIIIPNSVISIGMNSFRWCENITNVLMGNNVTSLGHGCFSDCKNLKSISIPNSMTCIETGSFSYCPNLTDVYYSGTKTQWNNIDIKSSNEYLTNATIHYNSVISIPATDEPCFTVSGSNITNHSNIEQTCDIIIAEYNVNKVLKNVSTMTVTFLAKETITVDIPTNSKIFIWNSLIGMKPLNL